jgi:hypothetical protein
MTAIEKVHDCTARFFGRADPFCMRYELHMDFLVQDMPARRDRWCISNETSAWRHMKLQTSLPSWQTWPGQIPNPPKTFAYQDTIHTRNKDIAISGGQHLIP